MLNRVSGTRLVLPISLIILICPLFACAGADSKASGSETGSGTTATAASTGPITYDTFPGLSWGAERDMEETAATLLVTPVAAVDSNGFLVAEWKEAQVRRYSLDGKLEWSVGRSGEGPGEYQHPSAIVRLPDGDILVADTRAKLVRYSPDGKTIRKTIPLKIRYPGLMMVIDATHVLLTGGDEKDQVLHVMDLTTDSVVSSFFNGHDHVQNKGFANSANFASVAMRADTLAVVFSIADSIFYFNTAGKQLGVVPLPPKTFRVIAPAIPPKVNDDSNVRAAFLASFDMVSRILWLRDGTIVVTSFSADPNDAGSKVFRLIHMTRDGKLLKATAIPKLLAHDPRTDSLYFTAPSIDEPTKWVAAALKR